MAEHRDSQGLYRILRVDPEAGEEEIQLAYEHLEEITPEERGASKGAIDRAYGILSNPATRRIYDRSENARPPRGRKGPSRLDDWRLLAACVVVLAAILGFVWVPLYGSRFRSFSAGDRLVDTAGLEFGRVVRSEERHVFPGGQASPAYLVEATGSQELRWYPALDVQSSCRRAR